MWLLFREFQELTLRRKPWMSFKNLKEVVELCLEEMDPKAKEQMQ